ncbi:MAG TPA: hypothetical protein VF850_08960 [Gemmatimonadaceae bacterium]
MSSCYLVPRANHLGPLTLFFSQFLRARMMVGVIVPLMIAATACHHTPRTSAAAIEPDSLRGIVSVTGTAFEQRLVLRSGNGATPLSAATSDSAALSRLGGVEVLVVGRRGPDFVRVEHFTALKVAGSPVVDGVLRNDGGRLVLETTHGTILLGNPPSVLRDMIGARVWIGGPLDTGPNTYGVIVPAR